MVINSVYHRDKSKVVIILAEISSNSLSNSTFDFVISNSFCCLLVRPTSFVSKSDQCYGKAEFHLTVSESCN